MDTGIQLPFGVKKSSTFKNKFEKTKQSHKLEEKIPQDVEMEMEFEDKFNMQVDESGSDSGEADMEIEQEPSIDTPPIDKEQSLLEAAKAKRAERRKTILKELEVCDLLDLRNP